jgi:hypothetical protein
MLLVLMRLLLLFVPAVTAACVLCLRRHWKNFHPHISTLPSMPLLLLHDTAQLPLLLLMALLLLLLLLVAPCRGLGSHAPSCCHLLHSETYPPPAGQQNTAAESKEPQQDSSACNCNTD